MRLTFGLRQGLCTQIAIKVGMQKQAENNILIQLLFEIHNVMCFTKNKSNNDNFPENQTPQSLIGPKKDGLERSPGQGQHQQLFFWGYGSSTKIKPRFVHKRIYLIGSGHLDFVGFSDNLFLGKIIYLAFYCFIFLTSLAIGHSQLL